jgi:hypothetical protein
MIKCMDTDIMSRMIIEPMHPIQHKVSLTGVLVDQLSSSLQNKLTAARFELSRRA